MTSTQRSLREWLFEIRSEDPLIRQRGTIMLWILFPLLVTNLVFASYILPNSENVLRGAIMFTIAEAFYVVGVILARRGNVNASGLCVTLLLSVLMLIQPLLVGGFNLYLLILLLPLTLSGLVLSSRYVLMLFTLNAGTLLAYKAAGLPNKPGINLPEYFVFSLVLLFMLISLAAWINAWVSESSFARLAQVAALERSKLEEEARRARAEEASAAKNRFLANMSHELRTPLNAILGYTEILLEEHEDEGTTDTQTHADLGRVHDAGLHLLQLIDDVLDLSHIESGELMIRPDRFDLSALTRDIAKEHAPTLEARSNTLHLEGVDATLMVTTDRERIAQILDNLVDNAVKFTQDGHIHVRVRKDTSLTLEVEDTGIGMTSEQQVHLFEAFAQGDDSTTRTHDGTGLGLTLCKRLCELLGGDIEVDSTLGQGTTFRVSLPI